METNTKKKIGLLGCIGTGIGAIIGSGIFGSLPTVINDIGTGRIVLSYNQIIVKFIVIFFSSFRQISIKNII